MPTRSYLPVCFVLLVALAACAPRYTVRDRPEGWSQSGTACWYGGEFHGRRTASGEIFDENKLTAAHPSLPFGTIVRVTNTANDRSVLVRINDRGPWKRGRIIDLSRAAADQIGMIQTGLAEVEIEVVHTP
ncbi:MAG: septal ring lytic transglycosylase RlpA family protein [Deltaproteobacteria bacterium]|nr:septal ring lytic transglycosylase RlpA family protein [Deltaproteobacteria bacterium]